MAPVEGDVDFNEYSIAAVIPAYKVEREITGVLASLPAYLRHVIVVDDGSPDSTGERVRQFAERDTRVVLLSHERNRGVGGAMVTGFKKALELGAQIVVKVDGDGQMPVELLPELLRPLFSGKADLTKGNRFRDLPSLARMPLIRRMGNAGLSFLAKAATGYWNSFDPSNGFLALRGELLRQVRMERIAARYFFEISLLSEVYLLRGCVQDVAMPARYGSEISNMSIAKVLIDFPPRLLAAFLRRMLLTYAVYDFSMGSVYLFAGALLLLFGLIFGGANWIRYARLGVAAPTGTVMLATLPVILGFQMLLSAIAIDLQSVPREPACGPLRLTADLGRANQERR